MCFVFSQSADTNAKKRIKHRNPAAGERSRRVAPSYTEKNVLKRIQRNKIKILLRSEMICAIMIPVIPNAALWYFVGSSDGALCSNYL